MKTNRLASLLLLLSLSAEAQQVMYLQNQGVPKGPISAINCGAGTSCVRSEGFGYGIATITASNDGGQSGGGGTYTGTGAISIDDSNVISCTPASGVANGCIAATAQTIGGAKTWLGDAGFAGAVQIAGVVVSASQFVSLGTYNGGTNDGGGNFVCPGNPATSSPCVANFNQSLEMGGKTPDPADTFNADVFIGAMQDRTDGPVVTILNNYGRAGGMGTEKHVADFWYNGEFRPGGYIRFGQLEANDQRIINPNGALYTEMAGTNYVFNTSGAGADITQFFNSTAATVASVQNDGALCSASTKTAHTSALISGSKTITVVAGSTCVCGKVTNASNGITCSVSGTTMTATGTGTDQFSYVCIGVPQ